MFVLVCEIAIGNLIFKQVREVRVEKTWRDLVYQKAFLQLPGLQNRLAEKIKAGMPVTIKLGYTGSRHAQGLKQEFTGFVKFVRPNLPFEIECEDEMYLFRKTKLKAKSWQQAEKVTLKEIIQYVVDSVNATHGLTIALSEAIPDVRFDKFDIEQGVNGAHALQTLREGPYGLTVYIKDKKLFAGLAYQPNRKIEVVTYSFAQNIIDHDLEFRKAEDVSLKVKAIGVAKDNKTFEVIVPNAPDDDAEERTLYFYSVTNTDDLRKLAEEEMRRLRYTGFRGDFKSFLIPYAEPLMTCELYDPQYNQERSGRYVIDSVKTTFGASGGRREVELGLRVDNNNRPVDA
jgi:hypothetical protein